MFTTALQIPLNEIEFCSCDMAEILRMQKFHLYPPRFTIKVNGVGARGSAILNGEITGFTKSVLIQEALCGKCHMPWEFF